VAQARTVELGQFTDENAELVAAALHGAGITWWHKGSGRFTRLLSAGDWGVRIFVDETRVEEARELAAAAIEAD
jgi:hypothetical protein